jgi:hypothetical protein
MSAVPVAAVRGCAADAGDVAIPWSRILRNEVSTTNCKPTSALAEELTIA